MALAFLINRRVNFHIFRRRLPISCRCLCSGAKRRLSKADPLLDKILRVDHAGEVGANRIYQGQMAVLGSSKSARVIEVRLRFCLTCQPQKIQNQMDTPFP